MVTASPGRDLLSGHGGGTLTETWDSVKTGARRVDLSAVIDPSGGAIIAITGSGLISHCNQAAALLYGYRVADLVDIDAQVLVPPKLREAESLILRRVVAGENPGSHRTQRLRRDGTVVPVVLTFSPIFDSSDVAAGVVVIAHPISGARDVRDGGGHEVMNPGGHPVDDAGQRGLDGQHRRFQAHIDTEYANERVEVSDAQDRFEVIMGDERTQEMVGRAGPGPVPGQDGRGTRGGEDSGKAGPEPVPASGQ
jgi:PAS domain S-box-containing protein